MKVEFNINFNWKIILLTLVLITAIYFGFFKDYMGNEVSKCTGACMHENNTPPIDTIAFTWCGFSIYNSYYFILTWQFLALLLLCYGVSNFIVNKYG